MHPYRRACERDTAGQCIRCNTIRLEDGQTAPCPHTQSGTNAGSHRSRRHRLYYRMQSSIHRCRIPRMPTLVSIVSPPSSYYTLHHPPNLGGMGGSKPQPLKFTWLDILAPVVAPRSWNPSSGLWPETRQRMTVREKKLSA
jgi:hypothetical protein